MTKPLPHRLLRGTPWPLVAFVFCGLIAGLGLGTPPRAASPAPAGWATADILVMTSAPDLIALPPGVSLSAPWSMMAAGDILLRSGQELRDGARVAIAEGSGDIVDDGEWRLISAPTPARAAHERWQAREHLRDAEVSVGERTCDAFVFGRWRCGPDHWNYVGDVDPGGRQGADRCLWAHPSTEGPLRVAWTNVTPGRFSGRAGFTSTARVEEGQDPVNLRVFWNDQQVSERVFVNERGLRRISGSLGSAGDAPGVLAVEVQADEVGMRHFCFDLGIRPHRNIPSRSTREADAIRNAPDRTREHVSEGSSNTTNLDNVALPEVSVGSGDSALQPNEAASEAVGSRPEPEGGRL